MKKNLLSYIRCIALGTLTVLGTMSCSDDNNQQEELFGTTIFTVEPIEFEGMIDGTSQEIRFVAGAHWTATFTSSNNWVMASPTQGEAGEAVIRVTPYNDNKTTTSRLAELMVLVDGIETPFMVEVKQKSAAQSDIKIGGDVNEGVMTLTADNNGKKFVGTLEIESSSKWEIETTDNNWLSFSKDKEPQNGEKTIVELTVMADYTQFTAEEMNGSFNLQVPGTKPVTIQVKAAAKCNIYDTEKRGDKIQERLSYELVDTLKVGRYQTLFYVESNIAWTISDLPSWLEFASGKEMATNRKENGTLQTIRQGVGIIVKEDALSSETKTANIILRNDKGNTLKTVELTFGGIGNNILEHDFAFPATDPLGNDFSFEAKASYINPENRDDYWKKIELPFNIRTSLNYESIEEAPYHLIMCKSFNGRIQKEEAHWATLRLGDASKNKETNGLFSKEVYLTANDRGDADDHNGLSEPAKVRSAFVFIVPKNITFDDLFMPGTSQLKKEYEESFSHITQKQDHKVDYILTLEGLNNEETLYVPVTGGSYEFKIKEITTEQISSRLVRLFYNTQNNAWEENTATSAQEQGVTIEGKRSEDGRLEALIVNVSPNMVTEKRGFRFYITAFRGDGYSELTVLTFDIKLKK